MELKSPPVTQTEKDGVTIFHVGDGRDQSKFFINGKFNDRLMMESPADWVCGTHLPVKNYEQKVGTPMFGIMLPGETCKVYTMNGKEVLKTYDSLDALLVDGWIVD